MTAAIPLVWSDAHRRHAPTAEIWLGVRTPAVELPVRADAIRAALEARGPSGGRGDRARRRRARAVHDPALLAFLAGAYADWTAAGLPDDPGQPESCRTSSPTRRCSGRSRRPSRPRPGRGPGCFAFDTMTPIGPGHLGGGARRRSTPRSPPPTSWSAARPPPTRCCRPPGHHVTRAAFGGSCYLNNAAIAAAALRAALGGPVAIARRRRPPRQRHPVDLLRRRRRAHRAPSTSTRRGLVPALPRLRGRDRRGAGGREPQPAARAGQRATMPGSPRCERAARAGRRGAPRAGRRARRRRRRRATRRARSR